MVLAALVGMSDEEEPKIEQVPPAPFSEVDTSAPDGSAEPTLDPAVDIGEDEYEYLFVVEVPGIPVEDIQVKTHEGNLEVVGATQERAAEQSKRYIRVERELGNCHRAFALPDDAEAEKLHYDMLDGVLHIHIPKAQPADAAGDPQAAMEAGKERAMPTLEPNLPIERPNMVRTITGNQESAQ